MSTTSTPKPRETRYHLPADEKTTGNSRRKRSIHGTRHGNHSRPFHLGEDVDLINHHNIDYQHPESIIELGRISTSAGHYN